MVAESPSLGVRSLHMTTPQRPYLIPNQDDQADGPATGSGRSKPVDRESALGVSRHPSKDGESINVSPEAEEKAKQFAISTAESLRDDKCEDILVLDLRGRSQVTDFFVIASGTSEVQMRAASEGVMKLGKQQGFPALKDNIRGGDAEWFLIDFVDVVVHVFEPDTRMYYDLEMLWGDAPRLDWAGDGRTGRNRANLRNDEKPGATDEEE